MRGFDAIVSGSILGVIHGLVLAVCLNFKTASFILYGDGYLIPFAATAIIDVLMLVCVLTYTWWVNSAQNVLVSLAQWIDELEQGPR